MTGSVTKNRCEITKKRMKSLKTSKIDAFQPDSEVLRNLMLKVRSSADYTVGFVHCFLRVADYECSDLLLTIMQSVIYIQNLVIAPRI